MEEFKLDFQQMKQDLLVAIYECSQRGLNHTAKFLGELNYALSHIKLASDDHTAFKNDCGDELEAYLVAKCYFDSKEYDRCAYYTKKCVKPKPRFLYFYSRYFSIEKKKVDGMTDDNIPPDPTDNKDLNQLAIELRQDYYSNNLDGYCLYLYGVILKKLDLVTEAISALARAVNVEPMLWCAWYELGKIIPDKNCISTLQLPDHWIKHFFLAHANLELLNNNEALQIYFELINGGLQNSTYIMAQVAIGHHNRRELDQAIEIFKRILLLDPYRLDNLDTYSNLLYVQEMKTELAGLAHKVVLIDKYRVETCCVIGNYYSLRSDHPKAVLYFRRALKLNPQFLSAWTLMGHEYMEMKNTNAAIQSYRHAIEINKRDYRAWYGLGQTYEILKMHFYSLYYYKQAQQLKPNDSRMIIALGETYEKLEKIENAAKCYFRAWKLGDIEGQALIKLAKLYEKLKQFDCAAGAYTDYCLREEHNKNQSSEDLTDFFEALLFLAKYHLRNCKLDIAYTYTLKCLENDKTKEIAKTLLKEIAAKRSEIDSKPRDESIPMDETGENMSGIENDDGVNMDITQSNS